MPRTITVVTALVISATAAFSQNDVWRRRNDHGNRYEGSRSELVSAAPVVELIGFHGYRAAFEPSDDVILHVAFYVPRAGAPVRLTAQEIDPAEYYWMEAKPASWSQGWNRFGPWPVRDVLRRDHVDSDNLAVLVRLDGASSGGGQIAPALILKNDEALRITEYRAHFVTGREIESIEYRLESADDVTRKSGTLGKKPGGVPFTVVLPVADLDAGTMPLVLSCKIKGESGPPAHVIYTFQHQPRVPAGG